MKEKDYIKQNKLLNRLLDKAYLVINNQTDEILKLDTIVKAQMETILSLGAENYETM